MRHEDFAPHPQPVFRFQSAQQWRDRGGFAKPWTAARSAVRQWRVCSFQPQPALPVSNPTPPSDTPPVLAETPQVLAEIGAQLRQARMERGQSIAELAQRLNMGQEQLRALESAHRAQLPEPVFVIAQIRRVASTLGLDVESAIQELRSSDALGSTAIASSAAGVALRSASGPDTRQRQGRSRHRWLQPLAAVVGMSRLGWLGFGRWMQLLRRRPPQPIRSR